MVESGKQFNGIKAKHLQQLLSCFSVHFIIKQHQAVAQVPFVYFLCTIVLPVDQPPYVLKKPLCFCLMVQLG